MTPLRQQMIEHGFSPRTHKSYLNAVTDLSRFTHRSPDQLTTDDLQAYFAHLVRERHLANCCRKKRIAQIRAAIAQAETAEAEPEQAANPVGPELEGWVCPVCQGGRLRIVAELPPRRPGGG
ncbi:site-specific integrase [Sedimenticola sp.]|uniref:site-specific integrase n=1 Tax=Sedimenticola sp. TaxID=1940285 RepID=UPI003D11EEF5